MRIKAVTVLSAAPGNVWSVSGYRRRHRRIRIPGNSFDKVVKLYGSIFLEGTASGLQPPGPKATVCFSNETLLSVETDKEGKVNVIRLAPSIE